MTDGPITSPDGMVAIKFRRQQRALVTCHGAEYVFSMQANISMCWVGAADVDCVLAVKGGCCGQAKPGVFVYANEDDVRRWTNGGGA